MTSYYAMGRIISTLEDLIQNIFMDWPEIPIMIPFACESLFFLADMRASSNRGDLIYLCGARKQPEGYYGAGTSVHL